MRYQLPLFQRYWLLVTVMIGYNKTRIDDTNCVVKTAPRYIVSLDDVIHEVVTAMRVML